MFDSSNTSNNIVYTFTDISINDYPYIFVWDSTVTYQKSTYSVFGAQWLYDSTITSNISITWLGKTYTGTLVAGGNNYNITWNYTDGVLINPKHN